MRAMAEVAVYMDSEEARVFIELRRINMKNGSVRLNYDEEGIVRSIDEYWHSELKESVDKSS